MFVEILKQQRQNMFPQAKGDEESQKIPSLQVIFAGQGSLP